MKNNVSINFTNPGNQVTAFISKKSCPYRIKVSRTFTDAQVIYKFNVMYSQTNVSVGRGDFKLDRTKNDNGDSMMEICANLIQRFMNSKSLHKNIKYINTQTDISKELLTEYHSAYSQLTNLGYKPKAKK